MTFLSDKNDKSRTVANGDLLVSKNLSRYRWSFFPFSSAYAVVSLFSEVCCRGFAWSIVIGRSADLALLTIQVTSFIHFELSFLPSNRSVGSHAHRSPFVWF